LRQPGSIYTLDEVIARQELLESEFYRRQLQPSGVEHELGMCFGEPNGWKCLLGIMNGPGRDDFGSAEKQFFTALRPHLERALQTYALLKRNELEKEIYRNTLDQLTIGTVILDGHGKVIESNQVARDILRHNPCVSLLDNTLVLAKLECRTEFNQMLKRALAWRDRQ
jgi:PAS domain-containing protein